MSDIFAGHHVLLEKESEAIKWLGSRLTNPDAKQIIASHYYLLHPELKGKVNACLVLSRIDFFQFERNGFVMSNAEISDMLGIHRSAASRIISDLESLGFITVEITEGRQNQTLRKVHRTPKDIQPLYIIQAVQSRLLGVQDLKRRIHRKYPNYEPSDPPNSYFSNHIIELISAIQSAQGGDAGVQHPVSGHTFNETPKGGGDAGVQQGDAGVQRKSKNIINNNKPSKEGFVTRSDSSDRQKKKSRLVIRKRTDESKPKIKLRKRPTLRSKVTDDDQVHNNGNSEPEPKIVKPTKQVRYMIQYWNEKSKIYGGVPKKLNERHGGNQTKNFQHTVKICNLWLKGNLFNSPYGMAPENMNGNKQELVKPRTYEDFTVFVDRFCTILHDHGYKPAKKDFLWEYATIKDFLAGNTFAKMPSLWLRYCLNEPEPRYEYKFEEFHITMKKAWMKYHPMANLTANDFVNFDKCLAWLIPWFEKKHKIKSKMDMKLNITVHLTKSIEKGWKSKRPSTSYLASQRFREDFQEYVKNLA